MTISISSEYDEPALTRTPADLLSWYNSTRNPNTGRHGRLILKRKVLLLTDTLTLGGGSGATGGIIDCEDVTFMWGGNDSTKPIIKLDRCDHWTIRGAAFDTLGGQASACVEITDSGAGSIRSNRNALEDCTLLDTDGLIQRFVWISRTGDAGKNDHNRILRCRAQDYGFAFAQISNPAAVGTLLDACEAQGRDHGQYNVYNKDDSNANGGGQFIWRGGESMQHQIASFRSAHRTGTCLVSKAHLEQDAMSLIVDDAGSAVNVNVFAMENCRLGYDAALQPADLNAIEVDSGILRLVGCTIGSLVLPTMTHLIAYNCPVGERLGWTLQDSIFCSAAPAVSHWSTGQAPTTKDNAWRWDGATLTAL